MYYAVVVPLCKSPQRNACFLFLGLSNNRTAFYFNSCYNLAIHLIEHQYQMKSKYLFLTIHTHTYIYIIIHGVPNITCELQFNRYLSK